MSDKEDSSCQKYLDTITKELTLTENEKRSSRLRLTLKDYLDNILSEIRKSSEQKKDEKSSEKISEKFALLIYAIGLIVLAFNIYTKNSEIFGININVIRFYWWIFAGMYLLISIEKSQFFSHIWKYSATKYIISLVFSALVLCSYSSASAELNSIFHIDASAFPFARVFITGLIVFKNLHFFLIVLGAICAFHMFVLFFFFKNRHEETNYDVVGSSLGFLLIAMFFAGYTFNLNAQISKNIDLLTYRAVHLLNFNKKNPCTNIGENKSVIFLGVQQNKVFIDASANYSDGFLESLLSGGDLSFWSFQDETIPNKFVIQSCITDEEKSDMPNSDDAAIIK